MCFYPYILVISVVDLSSGVKITFSSGVIVTGKLVNNLSNFISVVYYTGAKKKFICFKKNF